MALSRWLFTMANGCLKKDGHLGKLLLVPTCALKKHSTLISGGASYECRNIKEICDFECWQEQFQMFDLRSEVEVSKK